LNYSLLHPFPKKEALGQPSLGHPAYPRPKGTGDKSMLEKRGEVEVSKTPVLQGPNGMVKAKLPKVQSWLGHS
jgi:hypothetical protein